MLLLNFNRNVLGFQEKIYTFYINFYEIFQLYRFQSFFIVNFV